jgi:hypothetical protein
MKKAVVPPAIYPAFLTVILLLAGTVSTAAQTRVRQLAEFSANTQIEFEELGTSVAISGDVAVVGASSDAELGAAYVYVKPSTGWGNMTQTATLTASTGNGRDGFGQFVAISGDTIVVAGQYSGTVYVYVKPAGGWVDMTETAQLTDSESATYFGSGLAISGDTVIVGAYGTNDLVGTAYVYQKPTAGWVDMQQTGKLLTPTTAENFGTSVAISGNTVAVGAPDSFEDTGAVYIYTKPSGGWKDVESNATLTSAVSYPGDFGQTVAISGSTVVVGAYTAGSQRTGEAYIFEKPATGWTTMTETADLNAPADGRFFGWSVGVSGNIVIVAAPQASPNTAFIFLKPATGWTSTSTANAFVRAKDGVYGDLFGNTVSISGSTAIVGAPDHNVDSGAAYVY